MEGSNQETLDLRLQELIETHIQSLRQDFQRLLGELPQQAPEPTPEPTPAPQTDTMGRLKDSVDAIHAASGQREMANRLLNAAADQASRAALFLVRGNGCQGFETRGFFPPQDDISQFTAEPRANDPLASVMARQETHHSPGSMLAGSVISSWLDGQSPSHVCLAPVVTGGKTVAVLYADSGAGAGTPHIQPEAIEILASVAGMYLERLRSRAVSQKTQANPQPEPPVETPQEPAASSAPALEAYPEIQTDSEPAPTMDTGSTTDQETSYPTELGTSYAMEDDPEPVVNTEFSNEIGSEMPPEIDTGMGSTSDPAPDSLSEPASPAMPSTEASTVMEQPEVEETMGMPQIETETRVMATPTSFEETLPVSGWTGISPASDTTTEKPVAESEANEDARRFARLLVSEIVLYNEAQVKAGQKKGNLYGMLKEPIERSRESYNDRFGPEVSSYFDEELVQTLAMGDPELMGPAYTKK